MLHEGMVNDEGCLKIHVDIFYCSMQAQLETFCNYLMIFSKCHKTYIFDIHWNCLKEAIPMDTKNICKNSIVAFENYTIIKSAATLLKILSINLKFFKWMRQKKLVCMQYAYFHRNVVSR